jgi:phosphoglycerate dehydrogenase-like enzyme
LRALLAHPNVVCTPHLGASTEEAQINVARDIAAQVCDVFDQKEVKNQICEHKILDN